MLKVATVLPHEPYREYKDVERVYSGSTEIDKILDKNGNVLFAVNKEVEGTPALTYKGKEETNLKNYRIYGQTVDGESVGDRTANLFDYVTQSGDIGYLMRDGTLVTDNQNWYTTEYIPCKGDAFIVSPVGGNDPSICLYDENKNYITGQNYNTGGAATKRSIAITSATPASYIRFSYKKYDGNGKQDDLTLIMLNEGSTPLPYEPYGYKVPVTVSNGTDTLTTPIYLPEQIKKVGDEAEYISYSEQKLHRVRKNLLKNTAKSQTINGVTFTVNSDGSIFCNGQASPNNADLVNPDFLLPSGTYILTGCPDGGSDRETYKILIYVNGAWCTNDRGSGANFTLTKTSTVSVRIAVYAGYTCDNLTFYPMIRKSDIEDDTYEPYIEDTELDVTLPALPTLSGTNTLTVGTEVQPSNVYLKGRIKEIA